MAKIGSFIKGYRKETVLAPLFKLLEAVFELVVPLLVASLIDEGIAAGDRDHVIRMILLMLLFAATGLISSVTAQYFAAKAAIGFTKGMKSALFAHISSLPAADRDRVGTSTLITRLTSDATVLQNGINMFLRLFMRSPFIVFGAAIMAFTVDSRLAVIFAVVIPLLGLFVYIIMRATIPMYRQVQGALDRITLRTRENLRGVRVIRAFGMEGKEDDLFLSDLASLNDIQLRSGKISALLNPFSMLVINLSIAAIAAYGRIRYNASLIEVGAIVALVNYMRQILLELIKLANLIVLISRAVASAKRLESVFELEPSIADGCNEKAEESSDAIAFSDVTLIYREGGEPSLRNISFTVRRGEKLGIIGGTGSGKTSVVNLIMRDYAASSGHVSVFGHDVMDWKGSALRSHIGLVPQKAVLFSGTVRDNMRNGKADASDDEIIQALKAAEAYDFIKEKEGGLDYEVEEGGKNFSGGQRQRLSIARALVRHPDILILDDSSSALDYATEARLRHNISAMAGISIISISQRTSSMMTMDKVVVLDGGSIVDIGTHEELLKRCSVYQDIYRSQYGEEA